MYYIVWTENAYSIQLHDTEEAAEIATYSEIDGPYLTEQAAIDAAEQQPNSYRSER